METKNPPRFKSIGNAWGGWSVLLSGCAFGLSEKAPAFPSPLDGFPHERIVNGTACHEAIHNSSQDVHTPEEPRHQVKIKQSHKAPVDTSDEQEYGGDQIYGFHIAKIAMGH